MQFIRRRYKAVHRKPLWTLGATRSVPVERPFLYFRNEGNSTARFVHGIEGQAYAQRKPRTGDSWGDFEAPTVTLDLMRGAGFEPANPYGTGS